MATRLGLTAQSRPLTRVIATNLRTLTAIPSHALTKTIAASAAPLFGGSTSMQQQARATTTARAAAVRCAFVCAVAPRSLATGPSTHSSEAARKLQPPHGNTLVDLMLPEDQKQAAIDSCTKEMDLSDRNACDVELLVVGYVRTFT